MDRLPNGRLVARFESPHDTVLAVDSGRACEDFPTFLTQLEHVLQEAVESDTWERTLVFPPVSEGLASPEAPDGA